VPELSLVNEFAKPNTLISYELLSQYSAYSIFFFLFIQISFIIENSSSVILIDPIRVLTQFPLFLSLHVLISVKT
jgi:hypothetical protein